MFPKLALADVGVDPNVVTVAEDFGALARRQAQPQELLNARTVFIKFAHRPK
jgi:hypothetical protein